MRIESTGILKHGESYLEQVNFELYKLFRTQEQSHAIRSTLSFETSGILYFYQLLCSVIRWLGLPFLKMHLVYHYHVLLLATASSFSASIACSKLEPANGSDIFSVTCSSSRGP
jgi:hypothetical protein